MRLLHLACVPKLELGSEGELELGSAREAGAWQRGEAGAWQRASWGEEIEKKKKAATSRRTPKVFGHNDLRELAVLGSNECPDRF
jgi:hypothetical protein